jgi:hypothetical protein
MKKKCPTPITGKPSNLDKVALILGRLALIVAPSTFSGLVMLTARGVSTW